MALAAAQVVDALAARLMGLPLTGTRVYTSRWWPLSESEMPAWQVIADDESVQPAEISGINEHRLIVQCSGYARATTNLDDALHDLAEQGLAAVCALPALYGTQLVGIERSIETAGEASVGVIRLRLETTFFAAQSAPGVIVS
jgi:hypothetical protein